MAGEGWGEERAWRDWTVPGLCKLSLQHVSTTALARVVANFLETSRAKAACLAALGSGCGRLRTLALNPQPWTAEGEARRNPPSSSLFFSLNLILSILYNQTWLFEALFCELHNRGRG